MLRHLPKSLLKLQQPSHHLVIILGYSLLCQLASGDWGVSNALSKFHHWILVHLSLHVDRIKRVYVPFFDGLYIPIRFFSFHPLILSYDPYNMAHF